MKESNKIINSKIDVWAVSLANSLVESRYLDLEEIKIKIKSNLKVAMIDVLSIQITDTEIEYKKLASTIHEYSGHIRALKNKTLANLKVKLKSENKLFAELDRDRQAKEMCIWMREKHPKSIISFYKHFDEKFTR